MLLGIISIMAMTSGRPAAKYKRISDDREGLELGVLRQDEDLNELATRRGLVFVEDYTDNDLSASTRSRKRRPRYQQMLADARAGKFEVIAAYTTGRITRRPREFEDLIDLSVEHNIDFQYVRSPEFDLRTSQGRRIARILAANDAGEAEDIAERVQRKHRQLAENGQEKGGGHRPFGYETDRITVRESEAVLLRDATRRILRGGATVIGLVNEWNGKDIPTVTGKRWTPHVLRRTLMSARISGRREYHKVGNVGQITGALVGVPAIISQEDSDRLRELLGDPARTTNHTGGARRYLLTGFLRCHCGERMIARPYPGGRGRAYICLSPMLGAHTRVNADGLELYVTEQAFDYLDEFVNLNAAIQRGRDDHQETKLWSDLADYQQRMERLDSDYYTHNRLDERRYKRLTTELQDLINDTKTRLARVHENTVIISLPTSSGQARKLWNERGLEWRRQLVFTLIERITVGPGLRGRNRFDPDRIQTAFRRPE